MKKHWLYYISPCILAAAICVFEIVKGLADLKRSEGWSFFSVIIGGPTLAILLVADFTVKMFAGEDPRKIWIIEGIIIALLIFGILALWS